MIMDIVYVIGDRSAWDDNELRFSLRSVEKHLSGVRNIYIVGYKPAFITNVIHVPFGDESMNPAKNIATKLFVACQLPDLSFNFLFMADDHYFLRDVNDLNDYPYHYKGSLDDVIKNHHGFFVHHCIETKRFLASNGRETLNYDCHYPMVINKAMYSRVYESYKWNTPFGCTPKSLYANSIDKNFCETRRVGEVKYRAHFDEKKLSEFVRDRDLFTTSDAFFGHEALRFMNELYPVKSKYEV